MRAVYQAAGEKLTYYLEMIRSAPCHVIVISHPREFVKREHPPGKSARQVKEVDLKVLWTKMVPASSSNNHAFGMAKYFTDIAWIEVDAMGTYRVDYRPTPERLSGSHINKILDTRTEWSFGNLVKAIGGTLPEQVPPDHSSWLTIHSEGYKVPDGKKPALVLGAKKIDEASPD